MNPKKVLTGGGWGDRLRGPNARVHLEQPIIQLQTFVSLPTKKLQRASSKLTISKLMQAHERALGRSRSQRFRDNEQLKKIIERCRKDRLPALTLKLMRGDAPGSSVPLATHSATEEAIVMRPTRRSSRWDVSHEYTENVETEVKTEDSPERLTVSFTVSFTCRTKYAVAVCRNRLLFGKEHLFRYHYLIVLNFMLYYINEHHSCNVVDKYAMQKNRKNDYIFLQ